MKGLHRVLIKKCKYVDIISIRHEENEGELITLHFCLYALSYMKYANETLYYLSYSV